MNQILLKTIKKSFFAIMPLTLILITLNFVLPNPMPNHRLIQFFISAVFLILGMTLFYLGSKTAIEPVGKGFGTTLSTKNILIILAVGFLMGIIIVVSEPSYYIFSAQFTLNKSQLLISLAVFEGFFMLLALVKTIRRINLNLLLIVLYGGIFLLAIFADQNLIPFAFDSVGYMTSSLYIPFIIAFGIGFSSVVCSNEKRKDSFGYIALYSIAPIISTIIISIIYKPTISAQQITMANSFSDVFSAILSGFPIQLWNVFLALSPILIVALISNLRRIRIASKKTAKLFIGFVYTLFGLSFFILGAKLGFIQTAFEIGFRIATHSKLGLLLPLSAIIGYIFVLSEPTVYILARQIEEHSNGNIKRGFILFCLCISSSIAVFLATIRIITKAPIWFFIVPGYLVSLMLSFFCPKKYCSIAFDSGGVSTGIMSTCFMLPFAIGASNAINGQANVLADAYGIIALIALLPTIVIQLFGLLESHREHVSMVVMPQNALELIDKKIIELETSCEIEVEDEV